MNSEVRPGSSTGTDEVAWTPSEHELARRAVRRQQDGRRGLVAALSSVVVVGGLVAFIVTSSGWPVVRDTFFDVSYGWQVLPIIWEGLGDGKGQAVRRAGTASRVGWFRSSGLGQSSFEAGFGVVRTQILVVAQCEKTLSC